MLRLGYLLSATLTVSVALGQSKLVGIVKDQTDAIVPFANVLLLSPVDSSLVKGEITDVAGNYALSNIKPGKYLLQSYMIGYEKTFLPISISGRSVTVPPIIS